MSHITSKGVFGKLCLKFFEKNDYFHKSGGGQATLLDTMQIHIQAIINEIVG